MRDFLPADKAVREGVMAAIRESFASYGYREIETPVAEDLDRLTSGQGGDNEKLVFRILRRGLDPDAAVLVSEAADLGLRFDLTVPLARFYATHRAELPAVFRSVQIAPVWRAERPQKGRYRQFTQCDIDVLGEASDLAEVELISATLATLQRIGIPGASVRINDRRILLGLLDACGFPPESHLQVLIVVDKLDKVGVAGVADELRAGGGGGPAVDRLLELLEDLAAAGPADTDRSDTDRSDTDSFDTDSFDATLALLPGAVAGPAAGLARIREAVQRASPGARLIADPTLVRGMGYYTGPIFELSHPSSSGSVGGGGRYDGMIGRLSGTDVPACGFSIGFERIVGLVDPARFASGRRQVALVYESAPERAAPTGILVGWQRHLIEGGANVRLVARTRHLARLLDGLAGEGFEAYATIDATTPDPDGAGATLPLRPLRRAPA
jgi:histidyl-tRNA synthetase